MGGLTRLLLCTRGRITRGTFWTTTLLAGATFVVLFVFLEAALGRAATWVPYPPFAWVAIAQLVKRLHDRARSPWWLLVVLIPVLGPLWLFVDLALRGGTQGDNQYGDDPRLLRADYLGVELPATSAAPVVNDVTKLNPVPVLAIVRPCSIEEVQEAIARTSLPISVGGGHFSMGGQSASPGSLHLDMRAMNRILALSPVPRTIRVEAGVRWCDIQRFVDPHGLAVKIMQTTSACARSRGPRRTTPPPCGTGSSRTGASTRCIVISSGRSANQCLASGAANT